MDVPAVLPMFPLGTVLVPSMLLPLHVFEPRYRQLVHDCLEGDQEMGVVLIARGSEVGGGDVRTDVGTVARLVEVTELPGGRFALQCVGVRRIRVRRWLEDDPYPRAEVEDWPDEAAPEVGAEERAVLLDEAVARLRRALALRAELGEPSAPPSIELDESPDLAAHQVCGLSPLGPHDRQRLLEAASTSDRLALVRHLLDEAIEVLEARRALG